jgi:hypothetical protein
MKLLQVKTKIPERRRLCKYINESEYILGINKKIEILKGALS